MSKSLCERPGRMHHYSPITNLPVDVPGPSLAVCLRAAAASLIGMLTFVAAAGLHHVGQSDSTFLFVMSLPFLVGGMGVLVSQGKKRANRRRPVVRLQRGVRLAVRLPGERDPILGIRLAWQTGVLPFPQRLEPMFGAGGAGTPREGKRLGGR